MVCSINKRDAVNQIKKIDKINLKPGGALIKNKRRLIYCNKQFKVTLPNNWINAVGVKHGDYVFLEIDGSKLIVKKESK